MRRLIPVLVLMSALFLPLTSSGASKGIQVKTRSGEVLPLYMGSYALLIGMSDYTAGWPRLPNVPREMDAVEEVLKDQGFEVVRKDNLTGSETVYLPTTRIMTETTRCRAAQK